jgi:hypothetical protein
VKECDSLILMGVKSREGSKKHEHYVDIKGKNDPLVRFVCFAPNLLDITPLSVIGKTRFVEARNFA